MYMPRALGAIIRAEVLFNLKRVAPYLLFAFFSFNAYLWWGAASVANGWAPNSDYYVARLCIGFVFMTSPFFNALLMGDAVARDYRLGVLPLILSKPISRAEYLAGKFIGNFLVFTLACAGFILTAFLLQATKTEGMVVLPWRIVPYLKHFLILVVVSHLLLAAFCFTVGTLTRSVKLVYGSIVGLYVLFIALSATFQDSVSRSARLAHLFDPWLFDWGRRSIGLQNRAAFVNEVTMTYGGIVLANRLMMLTLTALLLTILYKRFSTTERGAGATETSVITLNLTEPSERLDGESGWGHAEQAAALDVGWPPAAATRVEGRRAAIPDVAVSHGGALARLGQFAAAVRMEFKLLRAERSLIILAPLVVLLSSVELNSYGGAFGASLFPLSSVYAPNSARALVMLLGGLTLFYTGEIFHRDRELKVEPLLWSLPVPDWLLLLRKYVAMLLLASGLMVLFMLTALALQLYRGLAPVELRPYLVVYGLIVLPSIAFIIGAALALHVLLRDKYLAHAVGVALGVCLFYLLSRGYTNWLYNPVLYRLWNYSDMTGLAPYRTGLLLHRVYWGAITVAALAVAHIFYQRGATKKGSLRVFGYGVTDRTWAVACAAVALAVTLATGLVISREIARGLDGEPREAAMLRYEKMYAGAYREAPAPDWRRVDLQVELYPDERRMRARGTFELVNRSERERPTVLVSLDPACRWQSVTLDGATRVSPEAEEVAHVFTLAAPLAPGAVTNLRAEWEATIPEGLARTSSEYTNFIAAGGTFLGGPGGIEWLPASGYQRGWEIADENTRRAHGLEPQKPLPELKDAAVVPPLFGGAPFDVRVEINVPADHTALSAGRLVAVRDEGAERRTFIYETDHPVNGFPILAARYAEKRRGDLAVYYHPQHTFNVEAMLDAMTAARRKYERDYGALPFRDLRIAEFPRLASFALAYPTIIPFSEDLVFLTREDDEHVNSTYFSVAHEVAHQWFGVVVVPGRSRGASVLHEGLAEYAAGALIEEELGRDAAALFRRHEEQTYLRRRRADGEPPLSVVEDDYATQSPVFYQKAGLVFHMLENLLGRDRMNAALREYVTRYSFAERHPTIHDLLAIFKQQTPDGSLDWFYEQWFERVTLPDFRIESAVVRREGNEFVVEFTVENLGEGKMPVTLEALASDDDAQTRTQGARVLAEQGKKVRGSIRCAFKPQRLVLDRMHDVIDAERSNNEVRL